MAYLLTDEETQRLIFRSIEDISFEQWLPFFHIANNARMVALDHLETPEAQCRFWFERAHKRINDGLGGLNALYEKESGQPVGQCGLLVQPLHGKQELEVGYSLLPAHWGKGYAIEAARKARDIAFERNYTDTLISIIHVDNEPSKKVARKNGMSLWETTLFRDIFPVDIFSIDRETWKREAEI